MWIKICGITRADDAVAAAEAGADAIGLVFADSPRRVSIESARQIAAAVDPHIPVVGVFVNADAQEILRVHRQIPLFAAQLHGAWTASTLRSVAEAGMRQIPALRFGQDRAALTAMAQNAMDCGTQEILLDAAVAGKMGGTGVSFDWKAARLWTQQFPETEDAAQQIMRSADVCDPVAHRFVDGIFERRRARGHTAYFGAQQAHAINVQLLPPHVGFAHVDDAFHAEESANRGRGDAVLPGAGLRHNPALAHAPRQQTLAQAVIDLVRAGVQQVFAFQINLCTAKLLAKASRVIQRCGTTRIICQQVIQLG